MNTTTHHPGARLVSLLHARLSRSQFLILACMVVGLVAGLAGVLLKTMVHFLQALINPTFTIAHHQYSLFVAPLVGILLTVLVVNTLFQGKIGKGIANILYEIAQKASFVHRDKMYSHIITSAITVGFGGSAGLEAPILVTGSALGANVGRYLGVNYKDRTLLLAAGAAAGIAAIFNAPITGVVFASEVLLAEVSITEFIPLIIAAVCGALTNKVILNEAILFSFTLKQEFNYHNVPFYLGLGLICGGVSLYYARTTARIEHFFAKRQKNAFGTALLGGAILAGLCFLFPPLFGEGYESIRILATGNVEHLLHNSLLAQCTDSPWVLLLFVGTIIFVKVMATAVTLASGGNGGNFASSLFVGAFTGFTFSRAINLLTHWHLPESNFTIVGMAGILSGVMYAPLSGIFLIAEITGSYELMIPLMIVSALSFQLARHFEPFSMDTKKLAAKGQIFTADRDKNILTLMRIEHLLEKDVVVIAPEATLGTLVAAIKTSRRNLFAVVTEQQVFKGLITLDDVREIMFRQDLYGETEVQQLMKYPAATVQIGDSMAKAMQKFDSSQSWNLPVLQDDRYLGVISKSSIFTQYRGALLRQMGVE
jgi:CIC family chloride channel protein